MRLTVLLSIAAVSLLWAGTRPRYGGVLRVQMRAAVRSVGALRRGFRQGKTQGDNLQQGGILAIAPDGRVLWHHISSGPGDNAKPADIARALR